MTYNLLSVLAMVSIADCFLQSRTYVGGITQRLAGSSSARFLGTAKDPYVLCLSIPDPCSCEEIGALISAFAAPPDAILLDGDLGAGKTTFSRGFICNKIGASNEPITSPTYLLSNTYGYECNETVKEIRHMDLYRLSGNDRNEFSPLDLQFAFTQCISLIEWPNRLPHELLPSDRCTLKIDLSIIPATDEREMVLTAPFGSTWADRLRQMVEEGFIDDLLLNPNE